MTKTNQNTVWKPYPDYPFIEANQFGEVRTVDRIVTYKNGARRFYKGHVLKQHANKDGYMFISSSLNGKNFCLRVSRIVATCFIPNPDNLPEVDHIDCDPTNNTVSNLRWVTHKENIAHRDELGHTAKHNAPKKSVFAINLETGKVLRFESQSEAARQLNIYQTNVNGAINGRSKQAGGYLFTENESEITEERIQEIKSNTCFHDEVYAINLKTGKVLHFSSQAEAGRQLGIDSSHIGEVVKGKRKTFKGYWFTKDKSEITEEKIQEIKANMKTYFLGGVIVVDLNDFKVSYFKSQREASRHLKVRPSDINAVLKGRQKTAGGFCFIYADERAIEKVRTKFGNEVASEVKKLMA